MRTLVFILTLLFIAPLVRANASATPSDFVLAENGRAAAILVDQEDAEVVGIAADLLSRDIERVSGARATVAHRLEKQSAPVIVIGTLQKSALIRDLAKRGKINIRNIEGKWETFLVATVPNPFPGVPSALVIAGSDRRGAAYGAMTVSEAIGVSPWEWWADVPPQPRPTLVFSAAAHTQGPPSVKYRGIFINDEDWGLQKWSANTFENGPGEVRDIGPKTYAKVCELLLRLKANYLWPAMHPGTKAFNHYPENKAVADRYAIVMGSSHAEPMLRNNVDEWPHDKAHDWNPVKNLPGVLRYWEQRVQENGKYENVYTVGMRGIHDSAMPGGGTTEEKRERLEKIIGLQREMLAKHVNPDPARVPQIFVPYKEVLELYQAGMKVPDDITLMWPDDNFGYIRQLPNAAERKRSGGSGIYYHLSYWGRPHDYLWLESTAPALIWSEMTKAYELGAQQVWVVNVGDIKPIEAGLTLFLQMAWDMKRYATPDVQQKFLRDFYAQQFGQKQAEAIANLKDEYFRLCAIRRPEHLGFNRVYSGKGVPNTPVRNSDWSPDESQRLLDRWLELSRRAEAMASKLPPETRDAYFQLVEYPACAGAAMAEKIILAEKARLTGSVELGQRAEAAFKRILELTERYNTQNGGKWRNMMDYQSRKLPVFGMPPTTTQQAQAATRAAAATPQGELPQLAKEHNEIVIEAAKFTQSHDRDGIGWRVIDGLGRRGASIAVLPHKDTPTLCSPQEIREHAPVAEYTLQSGQAIDGEVEATLEALPTRPFTRQHEILAAVSINDGEPVIVRFDQGNDDENDPTWQTNVLRSAMTGKVTLHLPSGAATIKLWAADPGVVIQRISFKSPPTPRSFSFGQETNSPTRERIMLVGDSTVAAQTGWGDAFTKVLRSGFECINMGRGGRSSKSYREEGHWQKTLDAKPTWVLIQFGHNDMPGKGPELETDAKTTFRENLVRYVAEAREVGAKPVLVTSLTRRNFNAQGKIDPAHLEPMADSQGISHLDFLTDYVDATRAVAAEQNVPLIDLNARSIEQMNELGPKAAVAFDAKTKDPSRPDKTHVSPEGATETAKLVADEVRKNVPELAKLLRP